MFNYFTKRQEKTIIAERDQRMKDINKLQELQTFVNSLTEAEQYKFCLFFNKLLQTSGLYSLHFSSFVATIEDGIVYSIVCDDETLDQQIGE